MGKIKWLLLFLIVTSLILAIVPFLESYVATSKLELVQAPIQFTKDFNPQNKKALELKKCTDWHDVIYAWCVKSQYFPYKRLEIQNVLKDEGIHVVIEGGKETNLTKPSAWLLTDAFWNVFYVFYKTGSESGQYYGPYKIKK